jgi:hypothetical protein
VLAITRTLLEMIIQLNEEPAITINEAALRSSAALVEIEKIVMCITN